MNLFIRVLSSIDRVLGIILRGLTIACLVILLILIAGCVFVRFVPIMSFGWSDEIVEGAFAWMVFIGAAALWRDNEHFRVEWLPHKLKGKKIGYILALVIDLISLSFILVLTYQGWRITMLSQEWTPIFKLPKKLLYVCIPVSGGIMTIYTFRNIFKHVVLALRSTIKKKCA